MVAGEKPLSKNRGYKHWWKTQTKVLFWLWPSHLVPQTRYQCSEGEEPVFILVGAVNKGTNVARRAGNTSIVFSPSSSQAPERLSWISWISQALSSNLCLLQGWLRLGVKVALTLTSVLPGLSRAWPGSSGSGGGDGTRAAGRTSLPLPASAHYARCSVPRPISHGCWHLGHGHLFATCKSQRRRWREPRPLGIQALSMNHMQETDLGVALTLWSGIFAQAWKKYIWAFNGVLEMGSGRPARLCFHRMSFSRVELWRDHWPLQKVTKSVEVDWHLTKGGLFWKMSV